MIAELINSVNDWGSMVISAIFIGALMAALLLDVT